MNDILKTQKKLDKRLNKLYPSIKDAYFEISEISAEDLSILFQLCWAVYKEQRNPLDQRLKALELAAIMANILDDASLDNNLGDILVQEMAKYPDLFEYKNKN